MGSSFVFSLHILHEYTRIELELRWYWALGSYPGHAIAHVNE